MHQEIDKVVGKERSPTLPDRLNMPYVDATLMEIQRYRPVACFVPPRAACNDTEILGYKIPTGKRVIMVTKCDGMSDCAPLIIVSDVCLTIQAPVAEWLKENRSGRNIDQYLVVI